MRTIITDDILNECENILLLFSDIDYICNRIIGVYPNLSDKKKKSVPSRIKSYVNQGLRFLQETDDNIFTAPLTLFYSINNFAKAIYLTNLPNFSISNSHGIEINKNILVEKSRKLSDLSVVVAAKGAFKNLLEVTKDDINQGDIINIHDILSIIPELLELYSMRYRCEPNVFLLHKEKEIGYKVYLHKGIENQVSSRDFTLLTENSCHIHFYENDINIFFDAAITDVKKEKFLYYDMYGNEYISCGIPINGKMKKISKLASFYICFYLFSMLVRYYPETWISICDSADVTIIRKLLIHSRKEMMLEIIQYLLNDRYCFTTKLVNEPEGINDREIYRIVKQEYLSECKRAGKRPLI